jgi:murein DD-endopeptidase MepM/ murein hydrolase activator NlpD
MRKRLNAELVRALSRLAAIGLIGGLAAGCSSDSMRFSGGPFSNPFAGKGQSGEPRTTASVPALPRTVVRSQPLSAPLPKVAAPAPVYQPYSPPKSAALSGPRQSSAAVTAGPGGWTAHGGTAVIIGPGENINLIANRYGVPASAIVSANGLSSAAQAAPGRQIIIPVYNASGTQSAAVQPIGLQAQAKSRLPETLKPVSAKQAEAGKQHIRPGQTLARTEPFNAPRAAEPVRTARAEVQPIPQAKLAAQPWQPTAPAPKEVVQPAREPEQTTGSLPAGNSADFRWPARGRVISGFGGGGGNEGINIAVPEGTPVKAAEAGTVAYAGSEVKGYGNLVLIRHDNGFVSAYAHNGEISVKRGDKVKRGQVVAKSGQSGNVTSPQLHFEIRKGSTPVDPIPHLEAN